MWNLLLPSIRWNALGAIADRLQPGSRLEVDVFEVAYAISSGDYGRLPDFLKSVAVELLLLGGGSAINFFFRKVAKEVVFHAILKSLKTNAIKMSAKELGGFCLEQKDWRIPLFEMPALMEKMGGGLVP